MSYIVSEALEDVVVLAGLLHHPHALPPEVQHGGEQVGLHLAGGMMISSVLGAHPALIVLYHPVESEEGAGPADPRTAVDQDGLLAGVEVETLLDEISQYLGVIWSSQVGPLDSLELRHLNRRLVRCLHLDHSEEEKRIL